MVEKNSDDNIKLSRKVLGLTERLLEITNKLEITISNIKGISLAMAEISGVLAADQVISQQHQNTVYQSEAWLKSISISNPVSWSETKLSGNVNFTDLCNALTNDDTPEYVRQIDDSGVASSLSADFGRGLDDVHDLDLDWDTVGLELSVSQEKEHIIGNSYSLAGLDPNLPPLDITDNVPDVTCDASHRQAAFGEFSCSSSYHGIYEEAMEMSLELEEGFYSDDEDIDISEVDSTYLNVVSSSLASRCSSKTSVYGDEEIKFFPYTDSHSNYQLVNIDDDLESIASELSAQNSPLHLLKSSKAERLHNITSHCQSSPPLHERIVELTSSVSKGQSSTSVPSPVRPKLPFSGTALSPSLKRNNYPVTHRRPLFV